MSNLLILVEPYKIPDIEYLCPKKWQLHMIQLNYLSGPDNQTSFVKWKIVTN